MQCGLLVSLALYEDIDNIAVLIASGALQKLALALNIEEYLIHKSCITQSMLFLAEILSVVQTELMTPLANGFVANGDTTLG